MSVLIPCIQPTAQLTSTFCTHTHDGPCIACCINAGNQRSSLSWSAAKPKIKTLTKRRRTTTGTWEKTKHSGGLHPQEHPLPPPLQLGPSQALPCINTLEHNVIQFHSSLKASFSHCTKRTAFQVFPHPCAHNRRAFILAKERAVSTSMRKICTISCMLISTGVYATKRGHLKFLFPASIL